MKVRTQTPKLADLRRGVMELYISDHPLDCLTCSANGDCELQDMAGAVGLREVRYGFEGKNHLKSAEGHLQPVLHVRSQQVHRLLALRARLRRGAGHLRAHHRRPRVRLGGLARPARAVHGVGVRLVRRLRAGLPDRHADGQQRHRARHARPERRSPPAPTAAWAARSRPRCKGSQVVRMTPYKNGHANHGHSCVKGRFAWGYATHKDRITKPMIRKTITDPWREVTWDEAIGYAASEFKRHPAAVRPGLGRRHLVVALHQRRDVPDAEAGAGGVRQQQHRHLRPGLPFADRLRPQVHAWASRPAPRTSIRSSKTDVIMVIGANPTDGHPVFASRDEAAAARGRQAHRRRSAPDRPGAHAARRGAVPPQAPARAPTSR